MSCPARKRETRGVRKPGDDWIGQHFAIQKGGAQLAIPHTLVRRTGGEAVDRWIAQNKRGTDTTPMQ